MEEQLIDRMKQESTLQHVEERVHEIIISKEAGHLRVVDLTQLLRYI